MAQIRWASSVSGSFQTPGLWAGGVAPGLSDIALLTAAGTTPYTVTSQAVQTILGIRTAANATLVLAASLTATDGTDGGTNLGVIEIDNGESFTIGGTFAGSGSIDVDEYNATTELVISSTGATLTGGGQVVLNDDSANVVVGQAPTAKLTNVNDTITGAGQLGDGEMVLINDAGGVVDAVGGNALFLDTGAQVVTNAGLLEASGAGGGLIVSGTTISNAAGTIDAAANSIVGLRTADVEGGLLKTGAGGAIQAQDSASLLDGSTTAITNDGLVEILNNTALTIAGQIDNTATIAVDGGNAATQLIVSTSGATLTGAGEVQLNTSTASELTAQGAGSALTNVDNTIIGYGLISVALVNEAKGVIDATGGYALRIQNAPDGTTNDGLIESTGTGGLTIIQSTIDNSGGGVILAATGSSVNLQQAYIIGGTLKVAGSGLIQAVSGYNVLDGATSKVTNDGVIQINNNTDVRLLGAINNVGTISIDAYNAATALYVLAGGATLSGKGTISLNDNSANRILEVAANTKLVNVNNTIIGAGQIGSAGLLLTNDAAGIIDAVGGNQLVLFMPTGSTVNDGLIEATGGGGGLVVDQTTIDDSKGGILLANASVVNLEIADILGGSLETKGTGVIQTDGSGSTLDGTKSTVTLTAASALEIQNNCNLTVQGTIDNLGTISVLEYNAETALLIGAAGATLTGGGQVFLNDDSANVIQGATASATLTNVDNTISGAGQLGANQLNFINDSGGVVDAVGGNALILNPAMPVTNDGLMEASGSGGLTIQSVTVNNSNGGLIRANASSVVGLASADLLGGVIQSVGTGVIQTLDSGSLLDGTSGHAVTVLGELAIRNNTALTIDGSILLSQTVGTVKTTGLIDIDSGNAGTLLIIGAQNATIAGGALTLADDSASEVIGTVTSVSGAATVSSLTNHTVISGAGAFGADLLLINDDVVDATGGNALIVSTGGSGVAGSTTITNADILESTNPGKLSGVGGLTLDNVTVANVAGKGVVEANGAGTHVNLQTATISGGTLKGLNGGVFETVDSGSELNGVAQTVINQADIQIQNNTALTIAGAIDNAGTIEIDEYNAGTELLVAASGATLSGSGQIALDDNSANLILAGGAGAELTNVDNTISGGGQLGDGDLAFVNEAAGVVDASAGSNRLVLNTGASTVANAGLIEATGSAGLQIVSTAVSNAKTGEILAANGSVVNLQSAHIEGGVLTSTGTGQFQTDDGGTVFDGTGAALTNKGLVVIQNNTALTIAGAIDNAGTIAIDEYNAATELLVATAGATLSGAGLVSLDNGSANLIEGVSAAAALTNVNDTIAGAGALGNGTLTFVNDAAGVVDAVNGELVINTSTITAVNDGLIEATATGGLTIQSAVSGGKTGEILANNAVIDLASADIEGGILVSTGTGQFQTDNSLTVFDGTSAAVTSKALVVVQNNTVLTLEGAIANSGTIAVSASNAATELVIGGTGATLTGGGQVTLDDNSSNFIFGASVSTTLDNAGDSIVGAGQLGDGQLTLVNGAGGVIDAVGGNGLVINTGGSTVANAGTIEASGSGGLIIEDAVVNTGVLQANGGVLVANGPVTGAGSGWILSGTLDFVSSFTGNVQFNAVAGVLELAQSQGYTGTINGFSTHGKAGSDTIDLEDVSFVAGATTATFKGNATGGVLTVTDGSTVSKIALTGNYTRSNFVVADDGHGGTDVTVNATTPITRTTSYSGAAGAKITTTAATGVLVKDIDPNGLPLTVKLAAGGGPAHGTLTLRANGSFTYTPAAGFVGTDSFTYTATDGVYTSAPTKVTLSSGVGGPPTANPDAYGDNTGQTLTVTAANGVLANDTDPNGLALTAALAPGGGPADGALTLNADGSFTYTPNAGFVGKDTFSYSASDSQSSSSPATVTITVAAQAPATKADAYADGAGQARTISAARGVLANDTDLNGLTLTAALAPGGGPANGTVVLNADGSFTYTPNTGFAGKDTFTYIASDGLASSAPTTVTITVTTTAPTSAADAYSDSVGSALTVTAAKGVLANDTDNNGLALTAALAPGGGPADGTLKLNASGAFVYTPNAGFAGTDSFTYIASDSLSAGTPTTVTITVVANAPTANPDAYRDNAGQALTVAAATGVLANDSDPTGLPLSAALAPGGGPAHGALTLNADGSFTYTPDAGFAGKDSFTYIASDSQASSAPTTVTITVVARAPKSKVDAYTDAGGQALTVTAAGGVLANDTDNNGLSLRAALAPGGGPADGALTLNANGSFTYTPTAGFTGTDSFTYIASDSLSSGTPTTVTITVLNAPPQSAPDNYADNAGQKLTVTAANGVLSNDTDPNGLPMTAALAPNGGPAHGTVTLNANGSFVYTPALGFAGVDTFTYIASDSVSSGLPTTVTVDVTARKPTTIAQSYDAVANQLLTVDAAHGVLAGDTDPNGLALTASLAPGGGPLYGSLTLNANGSFSYILNSGFGGFTGTDTFSYIASDGLASSGPTLVTISIADGAVTGSKASKVVAAATTADPGGFVAAMAGQTGAGGADLSAAQEWRRPAAMIASPLAHAAFN